MSYTTYNTEDKLITQELDPTIELIIVVPSYNEESLLTMLDSLSDCSKFERFEVIILINNSDSEIEEIRKVNQNAYDSIEPKKYDFSLYPIYVNDIPTKIAGVGIARKLGMDEASRRFSSIGKNGIIACLDADCVVEANYVEAIIKCFNNETEVVAASIHYEHPFPADEKTKASIIDYELHLRYHIDFQKYLGLPYAFQTVGSSMAVRSDAYVQQGGMNKRKAGEDFYFIHKFTTIQKLGEIKNTTVFPSARISHRVPFGTGKAIYDMSVGKEFATYHYESYLGLKILMKQLEEIHNSNISLIELSLNIGLEKYLRSQNFDDVIKEIKSNTKNFISFKKRFYQWFNAFRLMKYLHFMRDNVYANIETIDGVAFLYSLLTNDSKPNWTAEDYLIWFRAWDRRE